jgi:hypothetical protein
MLLANGEINGEGTQTVNGRFSTVRQLMEADERSPLKSADFDDELWLLLCRRIRSPAAAADYPEPVIVYFATRYLQWEVGNGGFAQAAYNIPDWFALAETGYRALGKDGSAALIGHAIRLLPGERQELKRRGLFSASIGRVFEHFQTSPMAALDQRIVEADWYIDEERVAYARRHRESFLAVP